MDRRSFLEIMIATGLLGAGLPGCSSSQPLRMGLHPWIGYESLYLAEEFGWLPQRVRLLHGASATDSLQGLADGQLDAAALTLDEMLRARNGGLPLVAALIMDVSAGADVLMVHPAISRLPELAGKRIAVAPSALGELMLQRVLERAGLAASDIQRVDLPVNRHLEAWQQGAIDASVCYEPVASLLAAAGGERLFDSRQLPDTIFDVLAVNAERVANRSQDVTELIVAHFRGLDHLVRNPHDALYRVASRQQVSVAVVRRSLAGIMLPDLAANHRYLAGDSRIERAASQMIGLASDSDTSDAKVGEFYSARWLPRRLP